jgi:hypothetical protein
MNLLREKITTPTPSLNSDSPAITHSGRPAARSSRRARRRQTDEALVQVRQQGGQDEEDRSNFEHLDPFGITARLRAD